MRQPGGVFYLLKIIIVLAIVGAGFFCPQMPQESHPNEAKAAEPAKLLISEIQITGGAGQTENDFIELYNPNNFSVNLKGYRLVKRTKTGVTDTSIKSWTADEFIAANGYYLWVNSGYIDIAAAADAITTATLSNDNGIAIRFGSANIGVTVDSLAWGQAQNVFTEGSVFPTNPGARQSLERKFNSDANDNSVDFSIQENPNPRGSGGVIPPPAVQCGNGRSESSEQCDDGNLTSGDGCSATCQMETENPPNPLYQGGAAQGGNAAASSTENTTPLNPPLSGGTDNPPNPPLEGGQNSPNLPLQAGQRVNFGEVVINELVSDPADNEVEWLEIYNKTSREINLSGWRLADGSGAKTNLSGSLGASGSGRHKVIEKPAGNLNNGGDIIILQDKDGKIIDQASYGDWDDGNKGDNAPAAHDPESLARKYDGYNSFNNANDFAITVRPTKGTSNVIENEDEASAQAKANFDFSDNIFISEILPNPAGDDGQLEFIEIYNGSGRQVNLSGWSLGNQDNKKINFEKIAASTMIKAGEYLAFFRPATKIVLPNDQGEVKLFQPLSDKPFRAVEYKNVKEGWSYNNANAANNNPPNPLYQGGRINDELVWSEVTTPGAVNVIKTVNHPPQVEFSFPQTVLAGQPVIFDGSDTDDPDGDTLKFNWDFGDGFKNNLASPQHTFLKSGIYQVKLAVSDGQTAAEEERSVRVTDSANNPPNPLYQGGEIIKGVKITSQTSEVGDQEDKIPPNPPMFAGVVINEIFPDPAGADAGQEWLELKNQGPDKINLLNWRLENQNGKYKFRSDLWLEAENFYLLNNATSKLAFKNGSDIISLYNDQDELIDRADYADAVQGQAYARGQNGKWFWTVKLTPGRENMISLAGSKSGIMNNESGIIGNAENYVDTDLERVKEFELGSLVKTQGTVAVAPGVLGAQIFYLASASSSAGIQVYNYKKDFPALKVGDYIEVRGELSQAQDEFRIKTKDKNDISLKEAGATSSPTLAALALSCDQVAEDDVGQLVSLAGEITSKKSYAVYLDDGSGEILVYLKKGTGISAKNLTVGQAVAITGILSKTSAGFRLLPRSQDDIVRVAQDNGLAPQVLGEAAEAREWAVAERDKKIELFKYLLIIAGGAIVALAVLFVRAKRKDDNLKKL